MSQFGHSVRPGPVVAEAAERAFDDAAPVIQWLARAGYAAKGVVYCLVGLLAVLAALGERHGQTTGQKGAISKLFEQPGGVLLVSVLAVGLAGYALWLLVRGIFDPEHKGRKWKGLAQRAGMIVRGLVHVVLVVAAIGMVTGRGGHGDGENNVQRWTAQLMDLPFGRWLAMGAGLGVIGYAIWQLVRAWRIKLDKMLDLSDVVPATRRVVTWVSRVGIAARGVVFVGIGVGLVLAGRHQDPGQAKGVGGALRWLSGQPYGPWILLATAIGLIAYGFYEFVRARYRVIRAPRVG
ncbi:MAG TPA: DUF1206 domain-containing protein [Tepidisphaeraceae bacterium]|nr:DUF1206 domain-containing protein [Tepidisphaeraceae bacterium]